MCKSTAVTTMKIVLALSTGPGFVSKTYIPSPKITGTENECTTSRMACATLLSWKIRDIVTKLRSLARVKRSMRYHKTAEKAFSSIFPKKTVISLPDSVDPLDLCVVGQRPNCCRCLNITDLIRHFFLLIRRRTYGSIYF